MRNKIDYLKLEEIFTKYSHHKNVSIIFITQNLFHQKKNSRDISLNAHYIVAFKNPRDKLQFSHLSRQIFPGQQNYALEAFADATHKPHGYLFVDLKQQTPDHMRFLTNIFQKPTFYVPKTYKGYI